MSDEEHPMKRRIVYAIPEMEKINPVQVSFKSDLSMDIYYPPSEKEGGLLPAVIFVFGYSDTVMEKSFGSKLKDAQPYISWSQLMAASGLVAITYESKEPNEDIIALIQHLKQNAESLKINSSRIGIWSCSGNVPTALSMLTSDFQDNIKCAVLYYGFMIDRDDSDDIAQISQKYGFNYSLQTNYWDNFPQALPLFIVRAGLDTSVLNNSIAHFIEKIQTINNPFTLMNYANGHHAFDIIDDNNESRKIILQTLSFLSDHLLEA
ncbi:MAG: alpha/beta hydrolase [Candidatus Kariarchaeaceae archaeon]